MYTIGVQSENENSFYSTLVIHTVSTCRIRRNIITRKNYVFITLYTIILTSIFTYTYYRSTAYNFCEPQELRYLQVTGLEGRERDFHPCGCPCIRILLLVTSLICSTKLYGDIIRQSFSVFTQCRLIT